MKSILEHIKHKLLLESLTDVIDNNPDIGAHTIKHYYNNALSDDDKSDRMLNFLLKLHKNGSISQHTDSDLIKHHMSIVARANLKGHLSNVNTLDDLFSLTTPYTASAKSKADKIHGDIVTEMDTPKLTIYRINGHKAAEKIAYLPDDNPVKDSLPNGKAKWCVSLGGDRGENYFKDYTKGGSIPMHVIQTKDSNRRYAVIDNPDTDLSEVEFRDEHDKQIAYTLKTNNSISGFMHILDRYPEIKEHSIGKKLLAREPLKIAYDTNITSDQLTDRLLKEYGKDSSQVDRRLEDAITAHPNFDTIQTIRKVPHNDMRIISNIVEKENDPDVLNKIIQSDKFDLLFDSAKAHVIKHSDISTENLHKIWNKQRHKTVGAVNSIATAIINHKNADKALADSIISKITESDSPPLLNRLEDITKSPLVTSTHIDNMIGTFKRNRSVQNTLFASGKASDRAYLGALLQKNMMTSPNISYMNFPASVSKAIVTSPNIDKYTLDGIEKSVGDSRIPYEDVKHLNRTHFAKSIFARDDAPISEIDDFMNLPNDTLIDGTPIDHYKGMIIRHPYTRNKIKDEHLKRIINSSNPNSLDDLHSFEAASGELDRRRENDISIN